MRIHINTTAGSALFLESSSSSLTILSSSTICPFSVDVCLQILLSRSSIDISSTKHRNYNGVKLSNLSTKTRGMRAFCRSMDWETAGGPSRNSSHNISKRDYCVILKKNQVNTNKRETKKWKSGNYKVQLRGKGQRMTSMTSPCFCVFSGGW